MIAYGGNNTSGPIDIATACNAHGSRRYDFESETFVAIRNSGRDCDTRPGRTGTTTQEDVMYSLQAEQQHATAGPFGVRRLVPEECEALQGFDRGWTAGQSDSARYKQLGNAVEVDCAEWLGHQLIAALGQPNLKSY